LVIKKKKKKSIEGPISVKGIVMITKKKKKKDGSRIIIVKQVTTDIYVNKRAHSGALRCAS